jgi:hypothetical protein
MIFPLARRFAGMNGDRPSDLARREASVEDQEQV